MIVCLFWGAAFFCVCVFCFGRFYDAPIQHTLYSTKDISRSENDMENSCFMKCIGMNLDCWHDDMNVNR